jgi:hypothetical protein
MGSHGLADFCAKYVDAPALPDLTTALACAGFRRVETPADLSYTGIHTGDGRLFGEIIAIDPGSPGTESDLAVGDRITGFWPTRAARPTVPESGRDPTAFGLEWFEPGAEAHIGVSRAGTDLTATIRTRALPGGVIVTYKADPSKTNAFFARP